MRESSLCDSSLRDRPGSETEPGARGGAGRGMRLRAFRTAFPLTAPIAAGFLFLGCSYGLLMHAKGFAFWYPVGMAFFIFAGSMEFVTVNLLLSAFNPVAAFLLALMVNARHLFYGLSMLGKLRNMGWKKPYLIFAMCDETFAINSGTRIPDDVDRGWFMLFVSVLNRWYWIAGTALGWLVGGLLPFSTRGIEFVLTALFLVIFLDQWMGTASGRAHVSGVIGVGATAACLALFGSSDFMIPSMALMLAVFLLLRRYLDETPSAPGNAGDERGATTAADAASDRAAAGHGHMEPDRAEVDRAEVEHAAADHAVADHAVADHAGANHKVAGPRRDDERTAA